MCCAHVPDIFYSANTQVENQQLKHTTNDTQNTLINISYSHVNSDQWKLFSADLLKTLNYCRKHFKQSMLTLIMKCIYKNVCQKKRNKTKQELKNIYTWN